MRESNQLTVIFHFSYFSDENLRKDAFLLKHVRRNKEGLVSLKLVASFRKIKSLTKNWKVVAFAISTASDKLALNENETKVRRVAPLPDDVLIAEKAAAVDRPRSKSLVLFNVPSSELSVAGVSKKMSEFGDIVAVQMVRGDLPEQLKSMDIDGNTAVAVVEFDSADQAEAAVRQLERLNRSSWRQSMRARLVGAATAKPTPSQPIAARVRSRTMHELGQRQRETQLDVLASPNARRFKSHSCGDELEPKNVVLRQPRGPDGSAGFRSRYTTDRKSVV